VQKSKKLSGRLVFVSRERDGLKELLKSYEDEDQQNRAEKASSAMDTGGMNTEFLCVVALTLF
jgi:hypothetical protein